MSTASLSDFLNRAMEDPVLIERIAAIHAENAQRLAEALSALSREAGTPFTAEEFLAVQAQALSDAELEGVAGGVAYDDSSARNAAGLMALIKRTTGSARPHTEFRIQPGEIPKTSQP